VVSYRSQRGRRWANGRTFVNHCLNRGGGGGDVAGSSADRDLG
jgi:hypothetical protein